MMLFGFDIRKLFRKSTKDVCAVMQSEAKHLARIVERPWRYERDASSLLDAQNTLHDRSRNF